MGVCGFGCLLPMNPSLPKSKLRGGALDVIPSPESPRACPKKIDIDDCPVSGFGSS